MWCTTGCHGPTKISIKSQWNETCKSAEPSEMHRFFGQFWPWSQRVVHRCAMHPSWCVRFALRYCTSGVPSLCSTIKPSKTISNYSMWRKNCWNYWPWVNCCRCHSICCMPSSGILNHSKLRWCSRNACGTTWKRIFRRRCNTASHRMVSAQLLVRIECTEENNFTNFLISRFALATSRWHQATRTTRRSVATYYAEKVA